jgi:8-oxo-dGTP pyrophosphatase MutT (NUDIX family)
VRKDVVVTGFSGRFRQRVPRPPGADGVEPSARFVAVAAEIGEAALSARLGRVETVELAFSEAAPSASVEGGDVAAGVLLPVLGGRSDADPARLVLIRRATHLRANPGEIAFAGGRLEPGESPEEAALREAGEEIALPPADVHVVGRLPTVFRLSRAEGIAPFVGTVIGQPRIEAHPSEVDEVLVVPLADLARVERYFEEEWPMPDGGRRRLRFFELGGDLVWGASAAILTLLLDRLSEAALELERSSPGGAPAGA